MKKYIVLKCYELVGQKTALFVQYVWKDPDGSCWQAFHAICEFFFDATRFFIDSSFGWDKDSRNPTMHRWLGWKLIFEIMLRRCFWVRPPNGDHQDNYMCSFGDTEIPINSFLYNCYRKGVTPSDMFRTHSCSHWFNSIHGETLDLWQVARLLGHGTAFLVWLEHAGKTMRHLDHI